MKKLQTSYGDTYILAEIAQSYEGDIDTLLEIINGLAMAKADGAMFQVVYADELCVSDYAYFDLFRSLELSQEDLARTVERMKSLELDVVAEIFGTKSFRFVSHFFFCPYLSNCKLRVKNA